MELLDLYSFTERNNIKIMSYNLETLNAVTIKLDKYFIGILFTIQYIYIIYITNPFKKYLNASP